MSKPKTTYSYKTAGVDIAKAADLAESIARLVGKRPSPKSENLLAGIGGFSSLYEVPTGFKQPVLATATDGVGTKLALAKDKEDYYCLGIDLVAMCVNDLICCGAAPHLFLDYYATGVLDNSQAEAVIEGVCEGCRQADCLLAGGETAEMPGLYDTGKFDLAGFAVGIVEKSCIISPENKAEDYEKTEKINILGLVSNGVHANGFSLVRKLLDAGGMNLAAKDFMRPTQIYVRPVLELVRRINVLGIAHITGGGITENLARILPPGWMAEVNKSSAISWVDDYSTNKGEMNKSKDEISCLFAAIQKTANISDEEMLRTFNCGIGMIIAHFAEDTDKMLDLLSGFGVRSSLIGRIIRQENKSLGPQVVYI